MSGYALLPRATAGEPIKADWAWKVCNGVNAVRPIRRDGQRITTTPYGTLIDYDVVSKQEVSFEQAEPFEVRWYQQGVNGTNSGEWQVYLPYGCATVNGVSCVPVNDDGKDENGEATWQWYKIPDPRDADANVSSFNGYVAKEWTVYIHMKPWPRVKVSTKKDDKGFGLEMKRAAIATIGIIETDSCTDHVVVSVFKEKGISEKWDTSGSFALRYEIGLLEKDEKEKVFLTNQTLALGRLSIDMDDKNVTDWKAVWVRINHSKETFSVEVNEDYSQEKSNDDQTVFKIYDLKDNVVEKDERGSMPTLDFYTNSPDEGN